MRSPRRDDGLLESSQILITESRRVRAELDVAWAAHLRNRETMADYGLSLLSEAKARLDARERGRAGPAHRAVDDLF